MASKKATKASVRAAMERKLYTVTHKECRATLEDGVRRVLHLTASGTCLAAIGSLSDAEILSKLPTALCEQFTAALAAAE